MCMFLFRVLFFVRSLLFLCQDAPEICLEWSGERATAAAAVKRNGYVLQREMESERNKRKRNWNENCYLCSQSRGKSDSGSTNNDEDDGKPSIAEAAEEAFISLCTILEWRNERWLMYHTLKIKNPNKHKYCIQTNSKKTQIDWQTTTKWNDRSIETATAAA